jgi:hypothetical protein
LSVARAVNVCVPFATPGVFQVYDQLWVPLANTNAPASTLTSTLATALLSAAVPLTTYAPLIVAPDIGAVIVTLGGWFVGGGGVVTVTLVNVAEALAPLL